MKNPLKFYFPLSQGHPLKKSFRYANEKSEKKLHNLKSPWKLKKEPIKNSLGKGKSSFEFDLDNFDSDRNLRDDPNDLISFYQAQNELEKMHVAPVHEGKSVNVEEPHLQYSYRYKEGEMGHEPHHRVQSYAGEMIDDENTLSKFIAPPVFENHEKKLHQQETTRMLYGTPEAQTAENANTKSLLESLSSVMSPLKMSNYEQQLVGDLEPTSEGNKYDAKEKSNIEYEGKYKVVNDEVEKESEEYNHGNEDEKYFYQKDENHFTRDRGPYDNENHDEFDREANKPEGNFESNRDDEKRHDTYNERVEDYHSRKYEDENYKEPAQEESTRYRDSETRSPEYHRAPRYDGYDQQSYEKQGYDRNGKDEEESANQGGDKPIEVVQDDSGKLHPMSNNISKEELNNEIHRYMGNIPRN